MNIVDTFMSAVLLGQKIHEYVVDLLPKTPLPEVTEKPTSTVDYSDAIVINSYDSEPILDEEILNAHLDAINTLFREGNFTEDMLDAHIEYFTEQIEESITLNLNDLGSREARDARDNGLVALHQSVRNYVNSFYRNLVRDGESLKRTYNDYITCEYSQKKYHVRQANHVVRSLRKRLVTAVEIDRATAMVLREPGYVNGKTGYGRGTLVSRLNDILHSHRS